MDIRQSPLILSIPLGRWFGVDVRMSVWFVGLILIFCLRLGGALGLAVSAILFCSILAHEFAHVFGARATGGEGNEILMWPLGGLAFVSPAPSFYSEFWTTLAGPLSNAAICIICAPAVASSGMLLESLHPILLPYVDLSLSSPAVFLNSIFVLAFSINFKLLLLNLLPIYPLDGGQIAFYIAKLHWERGVARLGTLYLGAVITIILALAGMLTASTDLVFIGFLLMVFVLQAHMTTVFAQRFGEVGLGYGLEDEGESYLNYLDEDEDPTPRPGPIQRWKAHRREKRLEREAQQQAETSQRVDALLEKINLSGFNSLTDAEKKFLQQASSKYRSPSE
ncbi:putative zinc metalloprotease Rip3 [Thalassoglobus neptunius]|uniref:Putative zinc metalloprotease Rip3 n=2 Tax=Thalassoglobus neptunius TaxID=1938619 RepID=A0A5C5X6F5_9PLAN|nr:putative zinc metalloprotease Rip3 [Thalassoglobus neptunius]